MKCPVMRCAAALTLASGLACSAASQVREARVETIRFTSSDGVQLEGNLHLPKSDGRVPAAVLVHGSGRMTRDDVARFMAPRLTAMGFAVLAYDKRGVGGSQGEYSGVGPGNSDRMFGLLSSDALAGVAALAARPEIDRGRIGLVGNSQGGWIAPLAASRSTSVAFVVSLSGPAVTVGEEIAYSNLAGADPGSKQGLSEADIEREFRAFKGPHGYDPVPVIRAMQAPSLWLLGQEDRSLPVARTVENLERLRAEGKPITIQVLPGLDHGLRHVRGGPQPDIWQIVAHWLRAQRVIR